MNAESTADEPVSVTPDQDNDGGYASRKFWALVGYMGLVCGGYVATWYVDAARPEFGTAGGLMLAGLASYYGVNVAHKAVVSRKKVEDDQPRAPRA